MTEHSKTDQLQFEEKAPAPQIYVDGYQGVMVNAGVAKLAFFALVNDPVTNIAKARVVLHLASSVGMLEQIHASLGNLLSDLKKPQNHTAANGVPPPPLESPVKH